MFRIGVYIASVVGLILYAGSLDSPFIYDDFPHFLENSRILAPNSVRDIFFSGHQESRPVFNLSLFLQNFFFGTNVIMAHLGNLILHLSNAALFFVFLGRLGVRRDQAILSCLVFAIHPLAVESVLYFNSRSGLLALFFSFMAFCCVSSFHRIRIRVLVIFLLTLACLSKEDGLGSLPIFVLFLWFAKKRMPSWKDFLTLAVPLAFFALVFLSVTNPHVDTVGSVVESPLLYFIKQGMYVPLHLSKFFIPWPLTLNHDLPDFAFHLGTIFFGWTLLGFIFWISYSFRNSFLGLGLFWAGLSLVPTHSFVPLLDIQATRILYPMIPGISLFFVSFLFEAMARENIQKITAFCFLLFLLVGLHIHLSRWQDAKGFWEVQVKYAPSRWRAWLNYGIELAESKEWAQASYAFDRARAIEPKHVSVLYNQAAFFLTAPSPFRSEAKAKAIIETLEKNWPEHQRTKILAKRLRNHR